MSGIKFEEFEWVIDVETGGVCFQHSPCGELLPTPLNVVMAMVLSAMHRNKCSETWIHGA